MTYPSFTVFWLLKQACRGRDWNSLPCVFTMLLVLLIGSLIVVPPMLIADFFRLPAPEPISITYLASSGLPVAPAILMFAFE